MAYNIQYKILMSARQNVIKFASPEPTQHVWPVITISFLVDHNGLLTYPNE